MIFSCKLCEDTKDLAEVAILDCKHCFCLVCFEKYLLENMAIEFKCPLSRCNTKVDDKQLRKILSDEDLLAYDDLCMQALPRVHKCILSQCNNLIQYPETINNYTCSKCSLWNCIQCNSSHRGMSCDVYHKLSEGRQNEIHQAALDAALKIYFQKSRMSILEASKKDIFVNDRVFECMLCYRCVGKGEGIRLRLCFHYVCRPCLIRLLKSTRLVPEKCPKVSCNCVIENREVKCILNQNEYNIYESKSLIPIKIKLENLFQCRQANCDYFCELDINNAKKFKCPKCSTSNCLLCRDVHPGKSCKEHQEITRRNQANIEISIINGEFMCCPDCGNYVQKSRGCNWIKCPRCNLELCWVLKMRRWGPKGPGDTSGGCKCEKNKYCHPTCTGCIPDN